MPIGYRNAYANVRISKLNLARDYENCGRRKRRFSGLARAYQAMFVTYEPIKMLRAQREAFGEQVKANFQEFQAGKITPDLLLEAQRFWARALPQDTSVRDYNNALAAFELVKGTIPQHDNVVIAEGRCRSALGAGGGASAETQQRPGARERATPVPLAETHAVEDVPDGPASHAAALPDLWQNTPPLNSPQALPIQPGEPATAPMPKKAASIGGVQPSVPVLTPPPLNP